MPRLTKHDKETLVELVSDALDVAGETLSEMQRDGEGEQELAEQREYIVELAAIRSKLEG